MLKISLLSNWGHANRIGLTGLQCFSTLQTSVDDDPLALDFLPHLSSNHEKDVVGSLNNLINGKVKVNGPNCNNISNNNNNNNNVGIHCNAFCSVQFFRSDRRPFLFFVFFCFLFPQI